MAYASDVNQAVANFVAVIPNLSVAQLVLVQNMLLQEAAKRLYTT
jgi:hypothetical protein